MSLTRTLQEAPTRIVSDALRVVREVDRLLAAGSVTNARDAARESRRRRQMARLLESERMELRKLA